MKSTTTYHQTPGGGLAAEVTYEYEGQRYTAGGGYVTPGEIAGYPRTVGRRVLLEVGERVVGEGHEVSRWRVQPWERGAWLSSVFVSYRFLVNGVWYAGRGRGDGLFVRCRCMKRPPRGYA